jgi:hypothetical protein
MIYTHVLNCDGLGVRSPLDRRITERGEQRNLSIQASRVFRSQVVQSMPPGRHG